VLLIATIIFSCQTESLRLLPFPPDKLSKNITRYCDGYIKGERYVVWEQDDCFYYYTPSTGTQYVKDSDGNYGDVTDALAQCDEFHNKVPTIKSNKGKSFHLQEKQRELVECHFIGKKYGYTHKVYYNVRAKRWNHKAVNSNGVVMWDRPTLIENPEDECLQMRMHYEVAQEL
jgi:hypothetical protein